MDRLKSFFITLTLVSLSAGMLLGCGGNNDVQRLEEELVSLSERNTELLVRNATLVAQLEAMRDREQISEESLKSSYAAQFREEIAEDIYAEARAQIYLFVVACIIVFLLLCLGGYLHIRHIRSQKEGEIQSLRAEQESQLNSLRREFEHEDYKRKAQYEQAMLEYESKIDAIRSEFEQADYKRKIEHEQAMAELDNTVAEIEARSLIGKKLGDIRAVVEQEIINVQKP